VLDIRRELVRWVLGDDPPSVDYTGNPTQNPKEDIDKNIDGDPGFDEDGNRRDE